MPINKDIRSYADTALDQGKHVLGQAQAQLTDVTGQARNNVAELTAKAAEAVNELVTQAEKAVNLDAIRAAIEPFIAQARGYSTTVSDRAEDAIATAKSDKRLAKLVTTAGSLSGVVVETVQQRIVKPVQSMTGRGSKRSAKSPAAPRATATSVTAPKPTAKPAAATPARKATAARKASAKAPAKKATAKAPVKKATAKVSARKTTTAKAPVKKATAKS